MSKLVTFSTSRGRSVSFCTTPRRSKARSLSAYQRFVKAHLGAHVKKGCSAPMAMKKVAADWKKRKG